MKSYEKLLLENKAWAQEMVERNPAYFERMAEGQSPEFLWIGCSDSRVPAEDITNSNPGEIFVHRNVANMVVNTDLNLLSVLEFAVNVLKVKHVIVCGHYSCGGVKAALTQQNIGLINKWLRNIKDNYRLHREELDAIEDYDARADRMVELNVQEQVMNLAKTSIIQAAWKREQRPLLHGWVYGLKDGILKQLATMGPDDHLDPIYRYDLSDLEPEA
ncbi:MAG: carbonate dehydratase [Pseudomonadales bacterium]|jgi:carbonic anhydrase|nr:carbonate dehydratase [Gammaproteobacteria bacterium]